MAPLSRHLCVAATPNLTGASERGLTRRLARQGFTARELTSACSDTAERYSYERQRPSGALLGNFRSNVFFTQQECPTLRTNVYLHVHRLCSLHGIEDEARCSRNADSHVTG